MIRVKIQDQDALVLEASGTITKEDYDRIVPEVERAIDTHGKIRALVELNDFHGWQPSALVDELRFDMRRREDIAKLAVVGEGTGQEVMTKLVSPLFSGEVKYFSKEEINYAKGWLVSN